MPDQLSPTTLLIHGCAILLENRGLLIRGPSGSGKSRIARQLINEFSMGGKFARWVADDQVHLIVRHCSVLVEVPHTIAGLAERRFFGIDKVAYEKSARLDLVIDLLPVEEVERHSEDRKIRLHESACLLPALNAPEKHCELAVEVILGHLLRYEGQNLFD